MNRMFIFFSLLLSCSNANKSDTSELDSFVPCSATIEETYPLPNSEVMYYRDHVQITFSEAIPNAEILLSDVNGSAIAGETILDEKQLRFVPLQPLQPSTQYQASVNYCGSPDPVRIDFKTTDLGIPFPNGNSDLVTKTFAVDLESGLILEPAGVGELLRAFLSNTFLIHVVETTESSLSVRSAVSTDNSVEQDFCVATLDNFPIIDLSESPFFSLENEALQLNVAAYNIKIYQFKVHGTFSSDTSSFQEAYIAGELDA